MHFRWALLAGWLLIWAFVVMLPYSPRLITYLPSPGIIRALFIFFGFVTLVYLIGRFYREGMRRVKKK